MVATLEASERQIAHGRAEMRGNVGIDYDKKIQPEKAKAKNKNK